MFKRIDQSNVLVRLLQKVSTWLARNRGMPIILGIVFIILSTIVRLISIGVEEPIMEAIYVLLQNGGILLALIGVLLLEPLGK
jgi:hypothetical protein